MEAETRSSHDRSSGTHVGVEPGAVVLVVVGAVHGSVSHGDDPGPDGPVLRPVGLLGYGGNTFKRASGCEFIVRFLLFCVAVKYAKLSSTSAFTGVTEENMIEGEGG